MRVVTPVPFIFIVDKDGNAVDIFAADSKLDYIHDIVRILNKNQTEDAPHVPWLYNGSTMAPLISSAPLTIINETLH